MRHALVPANLIQHARAAATAEAEERHAHEAASSRRTKARRAMARQARTRRVRLISPARRARA
jgi:hypothetical protein